MLALRRGDRHAAISLLVQAYGTTIRRYCRRILGDTDLADDVYQTVLVQAFQDLPQYSGRAPLRTWFYSIARYRCIDALKARRSRSKHFVLHAEMPESPDQQPNAEELLLSLYTREALQIGIEQLPPRMKVALVLRFQERLSYDEMAKICQERPVTLRVRVARAMPLLRRHLRARGIRR